MKVLNFIANYRAKNEIKSNKREQGGYVIFF